MKNIQNKLIALVFILFAMPGFTTPQELSYFELGHEVNRFYSDISVTEQKLDEAQTLADLNRFYKPSWVREYLLVEVAASHNGKVVRAKSENDTITTEQKKIMQMADAGTDVAVTVRYMPENNLKNNQVCNMDFLFDIAPANKAAYIGGEEKLQEYLKNSIARLPKSSFRKNGLSAVKFTIDEEGQVIDALLLDPSKDEETDKVLLETVCNMPTWNPARYSNGTPIKQESVLTVGDHKSCMVNVYIPFRISDDN